MPRDELGAVLVVENVDAFPTVDLDDARQLSAAQPSELDCGFHRLTLTHARFSRGADSSVRRVDQSGDRAQNNEREIGVPIDSIIS